MSNDFEQLDAMRWASAVTAQARGESLEPEEREFKAAIEAGTPELAEESHFWRALAHEGETPRSGELSDDAIMAAVFARLDADARGDAESPPIAGGLLHDPTEAHAAPEGAAPQPREVGRPAPVLGLPARRDRRASVALSLGVAATLVAAAALAIGLFDLLPSRGPSEPLPLELAASTAPASEGVVPRAFPTIPAQEDCVALGPASRACIEAGALEVVAPGEGGDARIRVDTGSLRVVSEPGALDSVVETPLGTLRGRGASYEASVAEQPLLLILVVDVGEVELEQTDGTRRQVRAGERLTVRLAETLANEPEEVSETDHEARDMEPGAREARRARVDLLRAAQGHAERGDRKQAIQAYRALVDEHGASREARLARVSLGRLYLEAGEGRQALAQFRRYLRQSGGQLREEALYGEIRALRLLGRGKDEQAAISRFLDEHPSSIYAAGLRRRLEADGSDITD